MNNLLLDTSIIIDYLRRKDRENTLLIKLINDGYEQYISIVTHTELFSGKSIWEDEKLYQLTEKLFLNMKILFLDMELSKKAGKIRATYRTSMADALIAATAIQNDYQLVTLNTKDFKDIEKLKLWKAE